MKKGRFYIMPYTDEGSDFFVIVDTEKQKTVCIIQENGEVYLPNEHDHWAGSSQHYYNNSGVDLVEVNAALETALRKQRGNT